MSSFQGQSTLCTKKIHNVTHELCGTVTVCMYVCLHHNAAGSVWKDNRLTRISTIDSGFEFPFTDELSMHEPAQQYDEFGNENRTTWEILEPEEVKGQESNGERGGEGEVQCCGEMRGRCNGRGLDRGYSGPGPRR